MEVVVVTLNKLTALKAGKTKKPGMYGDGGGLYLQVTLGANDGPPARSWVFRYKMPGQGMKTSREMGLGPLSTIGLEDARGIAAEARRLCRDGMDPIEARNRKREADRLANAKALTFKDAAIAYITAHRAGWRNAKHADQWTATLETYAYPAFGSLTVQSIDTGLVMKALEPIWTVKPETAGRVRGRIEAVLNWATTRGYRKGENPARWRGHLDNLLPARSRVRTVTHHSALPHAEIGAFVAALREQEGIAARALEFTILTAARTGETIGARWDEIDLPRKVWTVPGSRMKAGKEHRVPLSARALEILRELAPAGRDGFVFPGQRRGRPLSNMAMLATLQRMGRDDLTVHGFRSTFRDWTAERTSYAREVAEMALAHRISDAVEAAYRRGDMIAKRARMMDEWATFCATVEHAKQDNVAVLRQAG
jgi:integrase